MIEVFQAKELSEAAEAGARAREVLEAGRIAVFPNLAFELLDVERAFLDPANPVRLRFREAGRNGRPTLLFYPPTGSLRGGRPIGLSGRQLRALMSRYADWAQELALAVLPGAKGLLEREFTTFRPAIRTSLQRLHMDAAIARPTQGRCWLRVFRNANGGGVPRVWQVGGHFEAAAEQFVKRLPPRVRERVPGASALLRLLGVSKGRATPYDHTMRQLRELMIGDRAFQDSAPREVVSFPAGSTWLAYTDVALHGAISGQHSLDQSFLIDSRVLSDPSRSSLRILERLTGRSLV